MNCPRCGVSLTAEESRLPCYSCGAAMNDAGAWLSIDTAPKDGRWVILYSGTVPWIGRFDPDTNAWWDIEGAIRTPKHWIPTPPDPPSG